MHVVWKAKDSLCYLGTFYHLSKKAWLTAIYSPIPALLQQQGLWVSFTPSAAEHPSIHPAAASPAPRHSPSFKLVPDKAFSSLHSKCHEQLQSSNPGGNLSVLWTCKEGASYLVAEPAWFLLTRRESRKNNSSRLANIFQRILCYFFPKAPLAFFFFLNFFFSFF